MALNSHFVSRFLTRPWEFGQRRLWYYDFDTDGFAHASSRSLFATYGLNTPDVENRLNLLIETPISRERERLLQSAGDGIALDLEWPVFRALALLLLLQPLRVAEPGTVGEKLEDVLAQTDEYADGVAHAIATSFRLRRISVDQQSPLLYPSTGYFPLLGHRTNGKCALAWGIPLSPWHAVIAEPKDVEWAVGPENWRAHGAGFVSNYSVGNTSTKVVIHPSAKNGLAESELRSSILSMRSSVQQAFSLCTELAELLRRIDDVRP